MSLPLPANSPFIQQQSAGQDRALEIVKRISPESPQTREATILAIGRLSDVFLYDYDHDGRITFYEFLDHFWAPMLLFARSGSGKVTETQFLMYALGPEQQEWTRSAQDVWAMNAWKEEFHELDDDHKGFITRSSLIKETLPKFKALDRNEKGFLTAADLKVAR